MWRTALRLLVIVVFLAPLAVVLAGSLREVGAAPAAGLAVLPESPSLTSYDRLAEVAAMTQHALRALKHATGAQGFNVGMNLGVVGGAGIAAHLHQHVVPRWGGDTNFMPVVGQTRVLPQLLPDTRDLLALAWSEV